MSINVTVSGNPISIKRGKMVTSDPYKDKKEFDKRRLLRLEQVRQQSKELAEDVRNKVRKEKKRQMGEIEKDGKEKLKNWQNRKLLELQNQYQDALDEIGVGHKEAEKLDNEIELLAEEKARNDAQAKNRGKVASNMLQVQKNEQSYKKAMPIQHRKLVRDIENTRAAMVSSIGPQRRTSCAKKRKTSADINITIPDDTSEDSDFSEECENRHLPSIPEEHSEHSSQEFCDCSECSNDTTSSETPPVTAQPIRQSGNKRNATLGQQTAESNISTQQMQIRPVSPKQSNKHSKDKSYEQSIDARKKLIHAFRSRNREAPLDTRISDRIKSRELVASQPDFCDLVTETNSVSLVEDNSNIRGKTRSEHVSDAQLDERLEVSSDECICAKFSKSCPCKVKFNQSDKSAGIQTEKPSRCSCNKGSQGPKEFDKTLSKNLTASKKTDPKITNKSSRPSTKSVVQSTEIPSKPAVKLKEVEKETSTTNTASVSGAYRVRHFDYPNRFERDLPSTSHVERITADSLEALPNVMSEAEWYEKIKQRDREAQIRGKKALEKERVQRDYEEMMKKLPMLQRKENIAQIGTDKPEYHMSEERLKELERQRQNRLENAFAKTCPEFNPKIVTLPSRKPDVPKTNEPFEILDGDDSRTLNLGKWDAETEPKKMFSAEEVQEIIQAFTDQRPEDRKKKLKQLLKSLKLQKEELIHEIRSLPKDDSVNALISDLNSFSDSDDKQRKSKHRRKEKDKSERKRRHDESDSSNNSSETAQDSKGKLRDNRKGKHGRSPLKKAKNSRAKVLVLQNMSTQTTPKPAKEKETTTSSSEIVTQSREPVPKSLCPRGHVPCDCNKENEVGSSEELCEILIKLHDDETPKVQVVRKSGDKKEQERPKLDVGGMNDAKLIDKEEVALEASKSEKKGRKKSPRKVESKSVSTETETFKKPLPKEPRKIRAPAPTTESRKSTTKLPTREQSGVQSKTESWKEHLSKNSMSTSSTSYLSPPDYSKPNTTANTEISIGSLYNLRKKPQQTNFDQSSAKMSSSTPENDQKIDQRLWSYIKRLLSMSKTSVEELGVSTSEVQTPSQSIVEIDSNNPLAPLHNIVKFINMRAADIAKEMRSVSDASAVPPNSFVTSDGSQSKSQDCECGAGDKSQHVPEKESSDSNLGKTKDAVLSQYAEVTDSCSKRIANLAAMIEKLREEKIQMLRSPPIGQRQETEVTPTSDRDYSTAYLEFPHTAERSKESSKNSGSSMDEEEFNRRLLEIDMSLADKLKKFGRRDEEMDGEGCEGSCLTEPPMQQTVNLQPEDQDFLHRLQRLIEQSNGNEQCQAQCSGPEPTTSNKNIPYVPLLLDIPKLPILEPHPDGSLDYHAHGKRHPPPSKGLMTAKKFNGNISLIPHELSTIVEADSQLSTRISPNTSKICISPCKDTVCPPLSPTPEERSLPTDPIVKIMSNSDKSSGNKSLSSNNQSMEKSKSLRFPPEKSKSDKSTAKSNSFKSLDSSSSIKSLTCIDATCTTLASISTTSKLSSSSSSDLASIEAMLRSIGMDWAIPTLHKTQEALALTSSSSSGDLHSKRKQKTRSNSGSEVSLKDFLQKQMTSKISSSSLKSDASPASFLYDFSEISAIQANSSVEKGNQRTSTPVISSKSTNRSKEDKQQLFTGASDISSVRNTSGKSSKKQSYYTLTDEQSSVSKTSDL